MTTRDHDLGGLVAELQASGISVGVDELLRLQRVFEVDGAATNVEARALISSVLVKTADDVPIFDATYRRWLADLEWAVDYHHPQALEGRSERSDDVRMPSDRSTAPDPWWRSWGLLALVAVLGTVPPLLIVSPFGDPVAAPPVTEVAPADPEEEKKAPTISENPTPPPRTPGELSPGLVLTHRTVVPSLELVRRTPDPWALLTAAAFAVALAASLRWACWQRVLSMPTDDGDAHPLPPPESRKLNAEDETSSLDFVTKDERRSMVWGVESYQTDQLTPRVNVPRTVAATARSGGRIELHFVRETMLREVWIWHDERTSGVASRSVLQTVTEQLLSAGVSVRSGYFDGIPDQVQFDDNGEVVDPLAVEGRRDEVHLVLLTDGRAMQRARSHDVRARQLDARLRSLATWPRLGIADFGEGESGLPAALTRYGIKCLAPDAVPEFLGGQDERSASTATQHVVEKDTLWVWLAALSLYRERFTERLALEVAEAMNLTVSPWDVAALAQDHGVEDMGNRFLLAEWRRAEKLCWFARIDTWRDGVSSESALGLALSFWRNRHRRGLNELDLDLPNAEELRLALELEIALLDLWDQPAEATHSLWRIAGSGQADRVRRDLGHYGPAESSSLPQQDGTEHSDQTVALPWSIRGSSWTRLTSAEREQLLELGFWRSAPRNTVDRVLPRGVRASVAALIGIAAAFAAMALHTLIRPAKTVELIPDDWTGKTFVEPLSTLDWVRGTLAVGTVHDVIELDLGRKLSGTPGTSEGLRTPADHIAATSGFDIVVRWTVSEDQESPRVTPDGHIALFASGFLPTSAPKGAGEDAPERSVVVIVDSNYDHLDSDTYNHEGIASLIDGGWSDTIAIAPSLKSALNYLDLWTRCGDLSKSQVVFVGDEPEWREPPKELLEELAGVGNWIIYNYDGDELEDQLDGAPGSVCYLHNGLQSLGHPGLRQVFLPTMIEIPARRFIMGSPEDPKSRDEERPTHSVSIRPFQLSRTEITRNEYVSLIGEAPKDWNDPFVDSELGELPASHVSWYEAVRFCNRLSESHGLELAYQINERAHGEPPFVLPISNSGGYRLPSEAEWEYACRAKTATRFYSGDEEAFVRRAGWTELNASRVLQRVGEKDSNEFGLFDMHGNASEWCEDPWHDSYQDAPTDGSAWWLGGSDDWRVSRGGSVRSNAWACRSASRGRNRPGDRLEFQGFRVARSLPLAPR